MGRFARLHYPGGIFHIVSRCLNNEFLIAGRSDRQKYLELLERTNGRTDAKVLAYCLMSSHVHLVVQAGDDPIERLIKPVHTGYAVWKNLRSGRVGPVFAGRYKSPLVDDEQYLLELVRYVHNNPVRAGVAKRAADCGWSSHRMYVGLEPTAPWIETGMVLKRYSQNPTRARKLFDEFVTDGAGEGRRPELVGARLEHASRAVSSEVGDAWRLSQPVIGGEEFVRKVFSTLQVRDGTVRARAMGVKKRKPDVEELVAYTCAALGLERWEFDQQSKRRIPQIARLVVVWIWVRLFSGTQSELARALKVSTSRASYWYGRAVRSLPDIETLVDRVLMMLPDREPALAWNSATLVQYRLVVPE